MKGNNAISKTCIKCNFVFDDRKVVSMKEKHFKHSIEMKSNDFRIEFESNVQC